MGCCNSRRKGEKVKGLDETKRSNQPTTTSLKLGESTEQRPTPVNSFQVNIFNFKPVSKKPKERKSRSPDPADSKEIEKIVSEEKKSSEDASNVKESRTVSDDVSVDLKSVETFTMRSPSAELVSVDMPDVDSNRDKQDATEDKKKRARVQLNPVGRVVRAPSCKLAVKARKSHRRDEGAAVPDKRRRESVLKTLHSIGGYAIDKQTGKRVYIEPNTKYDHTEENKENDKQEKENDE